MKQKNIETGLEIAIIGMAGRFPGARHLDEFWENLKNGVESISFFTDEELKECGITGEQLSDPNYVKAYGVIKNKEYFDSSFFGYTPKEAESMDPQVRLFHECSWQALEDAGCDPTSYSGSIGTYAGIADGFSWRALKALRTMGNGAGAMETHMLDTSLLLSEHISHKLDLKGPSMTVFTACSTALVAVHLACRALLTGECDMALAGAVSIIPILKTGYLYREGMILSPDGHCRPFDEKAEGTVFGEGVGIVILKRLKDARADRDTIKAIIKGTAVNNDGVVKASFTSPGKKRIADVIRTVLKISRVEAGDVSYIETHGTATSIGDTIEFEALKLALDSNKKGVCGIGSVKSNIGHLDVTSGIAGLIKTVLALRHGLIPPNINFETPNPKIDFINSPFYVNTRLTGWKKKNNDFLLRAGVCSFGIGGTNAFVLLEEAPTVHGTGGSSHEILSLILLSARTHTALDNMTQNLVEYLKENPQVNLADVAYTLQVGRKAFNHRRMLVCSSVDQAIRLLSTPDPGEVRTSISKTAARSAEGARELMIRLGKALQENETEAYDLLIKIGMMWLEGIKIDWHEFYSKYSTAKRNRIPLPTYPFAGQRYWIDARPMEFGPGMLSTDSGLQEKSPPTLYPRPGLSTEYVAPGNEIEQALTGIWQGLFGIKAIGIHDDFYELGGDSLKAITAATEILQNIETRVPIVEIFQLRTIEKLGKYINNARREEVSPVRVGEKKEYYSLSSAQRRLYVLHQLDLDSTGYNNPLLFVLKGSLDVQRLERAFKQLISRHESLRTSFETLDEVPVQRVREEVEVKVEVKVDDYEGTRGLAPLSEEPATHNPQLATALIGSFIRPFDLSAAPLLRVGLIHTPRPLRSHPSQEGNCEDNYILMVDMHHIITDGTSVSILVREFVAFYAGQGEKLPGLRIQYKDYAQWQDNEQQKEAVKKQEEYWLNKFSGEIPVLNLPVDYTRPTIQSFAGSRKNFTIGEKETRILKDLAAKEDATLFMVLLSLYNIMLAKICSQEDIVVGTPVACRRHSDLQHIMGMLVNTLALRNYPSAHLTFIEFLRQVRDNTLAAFENQDYLFEDLVERVTVQRDVSRNPIFDTMFAMQNFGTQYGENMQFEINGLSIKFYEFENNISIFDLSLTVLELENGLTFVFEYCTKLFQPETIDRFIGFFKNIVSSISASPGQRISQIRMISEAEKNRVLYEFNDTEARYPRDKTTHALFKEQAERSPDIIAVIGPSERKYRTHRTYRTYISYRELNEKSNQSAYVLIEKGVGPDTIVGIMIERSVEMIIGILAILKAGAAYLPLDPEYPEERIKYMLKDSGVEILLKDNDFTPEAFNNRPKGTPSFGIWNLEFGISPRKGGQLVYLLYTSGSTGRPKGVMVEHHNVVRLVKHANIIHFHQKQRLLMTGSIVFDVTTFEIWGPLLNGLALYLADNEMILELKQLRDTVVKQNISVLHLIPQLFNQVLTYFPETFASLEYFLVGGDLVRPESVNRLRKQYPHIKIIHCYGPTENTTFSTVLRVDKDYQERIPIGKPIGNSIVYILDNHGQLQPIGVAGELCTGGNGVARGYLNNPQLTLEKFDQDFFRKYRSYKSYRTYIIYKTGDLARWLPDGNIELLGRIDTQIKIKGIRIEPGEIQNHLLNHEKIKEAVVTTRENGDIYLCAYIVAEEMPKEVELRQYLSTNFPGYMIPRYFIRVEKLPLTPSGKIDRLALPEPKITMEDDYSPPRNEIERMLVETWESVLGRSPIGITDNFFAVGGDSIKCIQVAARISKSGYRVEIKDIFRSQSIAQLATQVKKKARIPDQAAITGEVPLTPIQVQFLGNDLTGKHHFNHGVMLYCEKGFDEAVVQKVFTKIVLHHDALRMVYQTSREEGTILQQCRGGEGKLFDFEVFDFKATPSNLSTVKGTPLKREAHVEEEIQKEANRIHASIDLTKGPLVKLGLFKTVNGDHLLLVIHHLVIDGVSWRILLEDFILGYRQGEQGKEVKFQEKSDSFKYWAEQLQEYAAGSSGMQQKELEYWQAVEKEAQQMTPLLFDLEIPLDKKKIKYIDTLDITLDAGETKNLLERVNWAYNTEINDILLTGLGLAVHYWCGKNKVLVQLEGHGREPFVHDIDVSRTIGWFTGQYPVILDLNQLKDFSYLVQSIKENLRRVPNKGMGYGIFRYLTTGTKKNRVALKLDPEISFNYLGQLGQEIDAGFIQFSRLNSGKNINPELSHKHNLEIIGMILEGKLSITFAYNRYQYEKSAVEDLALNYKSLLLRIIQHCCQQKQRQLTPSDLGYPYITLEEFAKITGHIKHYMEESTEIQSIYPLSPMQGGMLYHSLKGEELDTYFRQGIFQLKGKIEPALLETAFNQLLERYDILRTVFYYDGLAEPVQIVLKTRKTRVYFEDVTQSSGGEDGHSLVVQAFKNKDKKRGFDLSRDILMRLSLFKTGTNSYELVWSFHHILMDGWCLGIIYNHLLHIYGCLNLGKPVELERAVPYKTYIQWLEKQDKSEGLRYWQNYLSGYAQQAILPQLNDPKKVDENKNKYRLEELQLNIDEKQTLLLNRVALENQVTINTLFQGLWGILLQKYNNSSDVVFGAVVSGRSSEVEGIEQMVGLFINTVPVRIKTWENQEFLQLLKTLQQEALLSRVYEYLPLADIQAHSPLKNKLIHHLMIFENYPLHREVKNEHPEHTGIGFIIEDLKLEEQTNYDFNLVIMPGKSFSVTFNYNASVYDKDIIAGIGSHLNRVIEQVLANPGILVNKLEVITREEKQRILYDFNNTRTDYPGEKTIHGLFEEQVEQGPDHTALVGGNPKSQIPNSKHGAPFGQINACGENISITYRELNNKSLQLARILQEKGVKPDVIVGIMVERSIEMIIGILGILKAGGAYLPIEPEYPGERIKYMLKDSGTKILLTGPGLSEKLKKLSIVNCQLLIVNEIVSNRRRLNNPPKEANSINNLQLKRFNLAYIIYTSGSTGGPKGVMVDHHNVIRLVKNTNYMDFTVKERLLLTGASAFDITTFEIWGPLLNGSTLFLVDQSVVLDAEKLKEVMVKNNISILHLIPQLFNQLAVQDIEIFAGLRYFLVGGDLVQPHYVNLLKRISAHVKILHMYGPTENTTFSTFFPVDLENVRRLPIGKPVSNSSVYIVDRYGQLQPVGVPGELCTGGDGVARGYLNNPQLTLEKFLPDFYRSNKSYRTYIYKTGDQARWLADGNIEFLGRMDTQVKIRGIRIEPGEIENHLIKHEKVKDALVMAKENEETYLCAYIVAEEELNSTELRQYLLENFPGYMVPQYIVRLDKIPLTPRGKVDRDALPEPWQNQPIKKYQSPKNEIETQLIKIWSKVLARPIEEIGIHDNFFELGGHSLKAMEVVSRIHKALKVKIPLLELSKFPTIKELAVYIKSAAAEDYIDIEPSEKREFYKLSYNQQRLWVIHQKEPAGPLYNISGSIVLEQKMDETVISAVLSKLIQRHQSLRAVFFVVKGEPVQRILDSAAIPLQVTDVSQMAPSEKEQKLEQIFTEQASKPFDFTRAPLFRLMMVKLEQDVFSLDFTMHHIISDGWSMEILTGEFSLLYETISRGGSSCPGPLKVQYKDFAQWQHQRLHTPGYREKAYHYWREKIGTGLPPLQMPKDYTEVTDSKESAGYRFVIYGESWESLGQLAANNNTTITSVLFSILNMVMAKICGQEDILIGILGAGRENLLLHDVVGFFVNTLVLKSRVNLLENFTDFLHRVNDEFREMLQYQDYPLELVVEDLKMTFPRISLMFNMINFNRDDAASGDELTVTTPDHMDNVQDVKFDMVIQAVTYKKGIEIQCLYREELFKKETIEYMMNRYIKVINRVAADPGQTLKSYLFERKKKILDLELG